MNWDFILLQTIVLIGIISFTIVAIYYVRHRHNKAKSILEQQLGGDRVEGGEFLKRYIPPEHRQTMMASPKRSMFASRAVFYSTCMLIPLVVLGFTGGNYYAHREDVLEDIVLLQSEIDQLPSKSYTFQSLLNPYAPKLSDVFHSIPEDLRVAVFRKKGQDDSRLESWQDLLDEHDVPYGICFQSHIEDCRFRPNSTVILSVEDVDENAIEALAFSGSNVIAFGIPENIEVKKSYIEGLEFSKGNQSVSTRLAVVGDRETTLGMDAGTNVYVPRVGGDAQAHSDRPQAISMYADGFAGGDVQTRVYATLLESTDEEAVRVVWMDFDVDHRYELADDARVGFEGLLAGIIRYGTEQTFSTIATWPNGHQYAAFFEEDTEDGYENSKAVSEFFGELGMPLTWYVLSNLANDNRAITRHLASTGEMACHGDNHDIMTRYTLAGQIERLARCMKVTQEITGQLPVGFRPPTEAHDANTLSALINVGMTHLFAENTTITQVPHLKQAVGHDKSLVSFPRGITDDFYLWHDLKLAKGKSIERMQDELDWIRQAGSLFAFSFHTQFMDNSEHFGVVKYLANTISSDNDRYVDTVGGMATWWRFRDAVIRGNVVAEALYDRYSPVMLSVGENGSLTRSAAKLPISSFRTLADIDSEI